jgi:hypothetical protein
MQKSTTNPMHRSPRCTARSKRTGKPCRAPAVKGWRVCRMHGARGGAPSGAAHGQYRHGNFTCEAIAGRRMVSALLVSAREGIDLVD